jgi:hypothetical protein
MVIWKLQFNCSWDMKAHSLKPPILRRIPNPLCLFIFAKSFLSPKFLYLFFWIFFFHEHNFPRTAFDNKKDQKKNLAKEIAENCLFLFEMIFDYLSRSFVVK